MNRWLVRDVSGYEYTFEAETWEFSTNADYPIILRFKNMREGEIVAGQPQWDVVRRFVLRNVITWGEID